MSSISRGLRAHIVAHVRAYPGDPRLSRSSIAAAHHMSPRTLDRPFTGEPWSVSGLIRHSGWRPSAATWPTRC
ncbi:MAG: hypothetical protein ACRDRJ_48445 [Streptosporangiaceae bacterium]